MNRSRRSKYTEYVSDLIMQIARSDQVIASQSRWQIFLDSLDAITQPEQLYLSAKSLPKGYVSLSELRRGGEQNTLQRFSAIDVDIEPFRFIKGRRYPLSSGELTFLKFSAQASLHIENSSLLLLDEPETHLHPNLIGKFASLLDRLLEATGSAAIIATHSVYFVREVFREQVTILRTDDDMNVKVEYPTLRTFGADVGAISYFVFGEDEPSRLANSVKENLIASGLSWQDVYKKYRTELSLEIMNAIRACIEGATDE